jgi:hypothetical protein
MENTEENCEMIWKIWMKCEMIWKIWKKSKLKSEKIWKIWTISVLVIITPKEISSSSSAATTTLLLLLHSRRRPPPPLYMYIHCFSELRRIILKSFFARDYASRDQIYHFIHLTLRLFSTPTVADVIDYLEYIANISENTVGETIIEILYENKMAGKGQISRARKRLTRTS